MMGRMGWATGTNSEGREIGYLIEATCDASSCEEKIDRGLAYACGEEHDGGEHGCGHYFCGAHLHVATQDRIVRRVALPENRSPTLCERCVEAWTAAHPPLS